VANGRGNPDGSAFKIGFNSSAANGWLDGISRASVEAIRPAAQAGAEELYLEALLRVPQSEKAHYFYGNGGVYGADGSTAVGPTRKFQPGNLRKSIYQVYSKDNSGKTHATYHVSWNRQKAPYGGMVEFGTSRAPAQSFIRKAYTARVDVALQITRATLLDHMKEAL
jgi:HK97 gp10 family phage protein